jgi:phage antirepressor YoqD-like protein
MNIEIQQIDNSLYVDSRIVADGFEINHKSLTDSLKRRFPHLKCEEIKSDAGRTIKYYLLTKRDVMILPVVCKTTDRTIEFQTRLVDAFLDMEEQLKTQLPNDPKKQALMLATQLLESQKEIEQLESRVEEMLPKERFHDAIICSNDCITIGEMAKLLGTGQNRLFKWLKEQIILRKNNQPYQEFLDRNYFDVNETKLPNGRLYLQTMVTPKGQVWLSNKYN